MKVFRGGDFMKVSIYEIDSVNYDLLKYAVIVSKYKDSWVFVRHRNRETWEIPGGRREPNEKIMDTMIRELQEETGAVDFEVEPICIYSVGRDEGESYGLLCYCEITKFGRDLEHEIVEIKEFEKLPRDLTYPKIQPKLFNEVLKFKNIGIDL